MSTWKLTNVDGSDQFVPGDMDIEFRNGSVTELTDPTMILEQRLRKATGELLGSNPFSALWGSSLRGHLGRKILNEATLMEVGDSIRNVIENLVLIQRDTQGRIDLDAKEVLVGMSRVALSASGTKVSARVRLVTRAGDTDVLVTGIVDA